MAQIVGTAQERQLHRRKVDDLNRMARSACAADIAFREGVTVMTVASGMPLDHDNPATHTCHAPPNELRSCQSQRQADCTVIGQETAMNVDQVMSQGVETVATKGSQIRGIVTDRDLGARHLRRRARHLADGSSDRRHRAPLLAYVLRGDLPTIVTAPVIYSLIVPFVILDLWVSLYQALCFRAWGVARVRRRDFFAIDRHKLGYLNGLEKANCVYCSYVSGLIAYVREVAARTEQYWCPIRHGRQVRGRHHRYAGFAPYGDGAAYREALLSLRAKLRK